MDKFELGQVCVDTITGFAGTVTGIAKYYGGRRYLIECAAGSQETVQQPGRSEWFDEERLMEYAGEPVGPGEALRRAVGNLERAETEIDTLQDLLDATVCTCTLQHKCPQHDPARPKREE